MSRQEAFEIAVGGGKVRGCLHFPQQEHNGSPAAAILICRGVYAPNDKATSLIDALTEMLVTHGLAAARFEHRCADLILDDFHAHGATHDIADAAAVFEWLIAQPHIDPQRIGLVGYSLGAVAATALARRFGQIARLCLLSCPTAAHIVSRMAANGSRDGGAESAIDPHHLPSSYVPSLVAIDSAEEAAFHARPALIVHGAADRFIDPSSSLEYLEAFERAGRAVKRVLVARADHAFLSAPGGAREACFEQLAEFFGPLIEPAAAPAPAATPPAAVAATSAA